MYPSSFHALGMAEVEAGHTPASVCINAFTRGKVEGGSLNLQFLEARRKEQRALPRRGPVHAPRIGVIAISTKSRPREVIRSDSGGRLDTFES